MSGFSDDQTTADEISVVLARSPYLTSLMIHLQLGEPLVLPIRDPTITAEVNLTPILLVADTNPGSLFTSPCITYTALPIV